MPAGIPRTTSVNFASGLGNALIFTAIIVGAVLVASCEATCPRTYDKVGDKCIPRRMDAGETGGALADGAGTTGSLSADSGHTAMSGLGGRSNDTGASGTGATKSSSAMFVAEGGSNAAGGGPSLGMVPTGGTPGSSSAGDAVSVCAGHANETVCVRAEMHHCGPAGESTAPEICSSPLLCQLGMTGGSCAVCNPGTFRCDEAKLERCADTGQYSIAQTCANASLCKESGVCSELLCMPNIKLCTTDGTLKTCSSDGSAFMDSQPCGSADLCDAVNGRCNACVPNAITCSGDTEIKCSADGKAPSMTACASDNDCVKATCKEGTGCSSGGNAAAKTGCSSAGGHQCDGAGSCIACVDDSVCGSKKCGPAHTCVDCTDASDCPGKTACKDAVCSLSGTCSTTNASARSCVDSSGATGRCTAGECVCTANCSNKCDGDDGCGGRCSNNCSASQMCQNSVCVAKPAGPSLYESCTPANDIQGNCQSGLACVGIANRGPHCYERPPCGLNGVVVFGMVCAQACVELDQVSTGCPSAARFCFPNGETGGTDTDGYCIPER
jgi:hypothetical protein